MSKIIGLTSGCFDLIHVGHIRWLENCRKLCDKLIVGIDSNRLVGTTKGKFRPIIDEIERLEMINGLDCVDSGFIVEEMRDFERIVSQFAISKVFKSERFKDCKRVYGVVNTVAELIIVPDIPGLKSTSWIIEKIKSGK